MYTLTGIRMPPLTFVMNLELEDEEQAALDAALSFLDEFEPLVAAREEESFGSLGEFAKERDADGFDVVNGSDGAMEPEAPATAADLGSKRSRKKYVRSKTSDFNPNRAREERKKELVYLRNKVVEMEQQLEELKQDDGTRSSSTSSVKSTVRLLESRASQMVGTGLTRGGRMRITHRPQFVWEEIACRQFTERHKAELENVKLKMMLEGQIKVAKSLESVLKKRSTTQVSKSVKLCNDGCRLIMLAVFSAAPIVS